MENYYQKEIETASYEQIRAWQSERLVKTINHVYENNAYYRKLMEEKKIETKMYIAFIMLLPVLFFLAKLLLSPWQDLMTNSGLL